MTLFAKGGTGQKRRVNKGGRPKKHARTLAELVGREKIEQFMVLTFNRAVKGHDASAAWVLANCPKDSGFKLAGLDLPRLDSFTACIGAIDQIGEMLRTGRITVDQADAAVSVLERISAARASIMARMAGALDRHMAEAIAEEQQRRAPPVVDLGMLNGPLSSRGTH